MRAFTKKQLLGLGFLAILLVAIPLTVFLSRQPQDNRSRAVAATTLSVSPSSTTVTNGQTFSLDIMLDPGTNQVSFTRLSVTYDPTKMAITGNGLETNPAVFPNVLHGPTYTSGKAIIDLSIGTDVTKVITVPSKIATITFSATDFTASPVQVAFGPETQVLSLAAQDNAGENVLASSIPGSVTISATATNTPIPTDVPTPTNTPVPAPTDTPVPTNTPPPVPTSTPVPTNTPPPVSTKFDVTLGLQGITDAGGNTSPVRPQRVVSVQVFGVGNTLVSSQSGLLTYDVGQNRFKGIIDMADTVPTGDYTVKVGTDLYLHKLLPGIISITALSTKTLPEVLLITGDVDKNNILDIRDFNILASCFGSKSILPSCLDKDSSDLDDNSVVDGVDYNLFVRGLGVQAGD